MAKKIENIEIREGKTGTTYKVHIPYYDKETGKRKFYSRSFKEKDYGSKSKALEMAKKERDEISIKIKNNSIIKEESYTLDEVFNHTLDIQPCSLCTKKKLRLIYGKYIESYFKGSRDFNTIKFNEIQKSLNKMVSTSRNDTIKRVFTIWKKMYRYAIAKDIVIKDETYSVLVPKSEVIEIKRNVETSYSELMEVIEGIQNSHMKENDSLLCQGALMIMYYTGLRPSETFALSSDDIDFSSMLIHVWKSVGTTSTEKNTIRKTKTECSIRYVPFSDELIPILKLLIDRSINGYLFKRDNGLFMDGTYLSNITRRISKGEFRPYQLRRQFSTDLITSGVDLRTAQELMGHKEVNMTVSYARSNENLKRLAITNRNKN